VVALPADDPRSRAPSLRLERLAPDQLITPPREANPAFHATVVCLLRRDGLAPALIEVGEPRVEAVLLAVAASGVLALLPESAAGRSPVPGIRLVPLEEDELAVEPAVLTLAGRQHLPTAAFLRAVSRFRRPRNAEPARGDIHLVA
jgi:hypothetical protein